MPLILSEKHDTIGILTLNNPEKRNALNHDLLNELIESMKDYAEKKCRVLVLRAPAGSKTWSAGHDVRELPHPGRDPLPWSDPLMVIIRQIQDIPLPVIAMVEGAVWGGACDLAFSCDMLVGCPTASFTMTPAKIGVPYNASGILHFMNLMPVNTVKEMFFTAAPLGAEQAYRLGILNDLVPVEELEAFTLAKAERIAQNSPLSIAAIKEQIRLLAAAHPLSPRTFEYIQGLRRKVYDSQDYREGIQSFYEKRKPAFTGE